MIITIDGPAGAGKSSVAKELARRLGFAFLDTGAMYRAVTLAAIRAGIDLSNQEALSTLLAPMRLEMTAGRVVLNGEDVSALIRSPEITRASRAIADSRVVRQRLASLQRSIGATGDFVCEGRDQGTIVFPDALRKFFLFADPIERAKRRQRQLADQGTVVELEQLLREQEERDRRDAARDLAPMRPADDAVLFDSTALALDEVVARMEQDVRQCMTGSRTSSTKPPSGPPCLP